MILQYKLKNRLYYAGLKKVIGKLKADGKRVNVLDIGTGTGLLSMMAVRCGADTVTACEAFAPMVSVAAKCIEANGMRDRITIIPKRSTDIVLGVDMAERANVLVTEVFDTELIGEGAIGTFTHALESLLTADCHVIPDNAVMYVQVVESPMCRDWHWLNLDRYGLKVPSDCANLAGDSIFDMQLTQFKEFKPLTDPLVAFEYVFFNELAYIYYIVMETLKWQKLFYFSPTILN
jgi:protein arginine N-methyltransferase 7